LQSKRLPLAFSSGSGRKSLEAMSLPVKPVTFHSHCAVAERTILLPERQGGALKQRHSNTNQDRSVIEVELVHGFQLLEDDSKQSIVELGVVPSDLLPPFSKSSIINACPSKSQLFNKLAAT
jgi:hypothetical protein